MRGLNKLYYLKLDIENINDEIKSMPTISSPQIEGMPHGSGISDSVFSYISKKEELTERLNAKKAKYMEELARIETIIDRIDDPEVRTIARMRFVQCMKWEQIGDKIHLDRTNCARKLKKYIKNMDI